MCNGKMKNRQVVCCPVHDTLQTLLRLIDRTPTESCFAKTIVTKQLLGKRPTMILASIRLNLVTSMFPYPLRLKLTFGTL